MRAGMPLKIAAKVDAADRAYFRERSSRCSRDPLVEFVGEIGDAEKAAFSAARAACCSRSTGRSRSAW